MANFEVNQTIELTIDKLSFNGGRGVARKEGFVFFVPFTLPGEKVLARISKVKKSYAEAECVEVIEKSPSRITPKCPAFGRCGGCSWQHIEYNEQVKIKKQLLSEYTGSVDDFFASPAPWNYRSRIQLQVQKERWGYFGKNSHDFVEIDECFIADDSINFKIKQKVKNKKLKRIELSAANATAGFSQVNSQVNQILIKKVVDIIASKNPQRILDLYCGAGNFTFPLKKALKSATITGVEGDRESIEKASTRAKSLNLDIHLHAKSCEKYLQTISNNINFDLILTDPPRTGMSPTVKEQINRLKPKWLLYISCNPSTLKRDLADLNYKIEYVAGFDMFPQTDHMETLCLLTAD